ncbi:MAG: DUF2975 domain-containing protein [Glycocaulis sp.]|uniref:DUF2975 domain-containing protein n=1 Tax=Glycocaulis sp. TaxID=1969725 RepID=UPI003F6F0B7F
MTKKGEATLRRRLSRLGLAAKLVAGLAAGVLAAGNIVAPVVLVAIGNPPPQGMSGIPVALIFSLSAFAYLYGVWTLGVTFSALARGASLFSPALSAGLRRVGLALAAGGVISIAVMPNLLRMAGHTQGSYLHFDPGAMALILTGGAVFLLGGIIDRAARQEAAMSEFI